MALDTRVFTRVRPRQPFLAHGGERSTGGRAQKEKILRMNGGISVDGPRPAGKDATRRDSGIRAGERAAPTWLQDRRRKPADEWNEMSEKEGRERERDREVESKRATERRVAGKEDGREYYGERRRTKERRRGAAPFSRGSIDASASFVDFRAENADARGRSGWRRGGGEREGREGDKRGGN